MITIEHIQIDDIPVLVITKKEHINKPLPTLIYYHGFTSGKETNLTISYLLAKQNCRVVLPECEYHGERLNNMSSRERELAFWDIVIQSIKELKTIKSYLTNKQLILNERIGVAGTSMGGMITAGSLVVYDWIKCAGLLMSTSRLTKFAKLLIAQFEKENETKIKRVEKEQLLNDIKPYDLYEQLHQLNDRALFIWHGKKDDIVPFEHAINLWNKIKSNRHVQMVEEKNRAHHISRHAILEATRFFKKYL